MFFIKVTDALTGKEMLIRGDLIFKIEEKTYNDKEVRHILFEDGDSEYVTDTMDDLEKVIRTFVLNTGKDRFKIFRQAVRDSLYPQN